jgi:C4-type Zn-finger protein
MCSTGTLRPMIGTIMTKECPMCGEIMRLRLAERHDKIPGTQQVVKREYREWSCPECDYFEEADAEDLIES